MRKVKTWKNKMYCKKCKTYRTMGGIEIKLFGLFPFKITLRTKECACYDMYKGQTELDKEKCKEVLQKQEDKNNDNN